MATNTDDKKPKYVLDDDEEDADAQKEYPEDMVEKSPTEASPDLSKESPVAEEPQKPVQPVGNATVTIPTVPPSEPENEVSFVDKRAGLEKTPSIWEEKDEKSEYQKKVEAAEREKKKFEKEVYTSLKRDAGQIDTPSVGDDDDPSPSEPPAPPRNALADDEKLSVIRWHIRQSRPTTGIEIRKIAREVGVDPNKVIATMNDMDEEIQVTRAKEEAARRDDSLKRMDANPPAQLSQPVIPGFGQINPQNPSDVTNSFIAYLLSQQQRSEDRAAQDRRDYELRNQNLMMQMLELTKQKQSSPFSMDGDLGQRLMSKMVSNLFSPIPTAPTNESPLARAFESMVTTGQFGQIMAPIVGGLVDVGAAALTKGKGGQGYDFSIPEQQQQQQAAPMTQNNPTQVVWTAKKFVDLIKQKDPSIPADVANVAAELVTSDPQMKQQDAKTQFKWIVAVIRGTEQLKNAAIGLHQYLIKQNKTPKDAADFVRRTMPDVANQLRNYDYDGAMRELQRFQQCPSLKKYIDFFYHPNVSPKVRAFFEELKNPTPTAPAPILPPPIPPAVAPPISPPPVKVQTQEQTPAQTQAKVSKAQQALEEVDLDDINEDLNAPSDDELGM